jgi:hypothetical protein
MHSQEKKIKRLLDSEDPENHNLAQLSLITLLKKENVLYWYLTMEPIKDKIKVDKDLYVKMTDLLGWNAMKPSMEFLAKMVSFIQQNYPSPLSIEKFFAYYNEYLYSLMSHSWTTDARLSLKSQIPQLNVSTTSTKSNKDL